MPAFGVRRWFPILAVLAGQLPPLLFASESSLPPFPVTGPDIPALRPIDAVVTGFMARYRIPGGALGIVRDGKLVFIRGYGHADPATEEKVEPDSLFRLASLSKPITAAAVLRYAEEGRLFLNQKAFGFLDYPPPDYPGAVVDPRIYNITLEQLLQHTGGWDRSTAPGPDGRRGLDPTVNRTVEVARAMGTVPPADATTVIQWMMGQPLQFDPGTEYRYSNFGYTVLGRIIEKVTGLEYEQAVRSILSEISITRMRIAGSRAHERLPGEVAYHHEPNAPPVPSIFPQDPDTVPLPYAFSYSTMDAHGGWAASVIDLLRFITAIDGRSVPPDILGSATVATLTHRPSPPWDPATGLHYGLGWMVRPEQDNWWHTGSLPGTATEMVRAGNGFSWVALFNFRPSRQEPNFSNDLDRLGWAALEAVSNWPSHDLFDSTLSYEAWRHRHFAPAPSNNPVTHAWADADRDPDADGICNGLEYALGLDPHRADDNRGVVAEITTREGKRSLTFRHRRRPVAHEVTYVVETSSDLREWQRISSSPREAILGDDGFLTVTHADPVPIQDRTPSYLRLKVVRTPQ